MSSSKHVPTAGAPGLAGRGRLVGEEGRKDGKAAHGGARPCLDVREQGRVVLGVFLEKESGGHRLQGDMEMMT